MKTIAIVMAAMAVLAQATTVRAHTGGGLDAHGCHADRRRGDYHCHNGELRGYSFASRSAMLEAVRTGNLPAKPEREGFFSRVWPFKGKSDENAAASADAQHEAEARNDAPAAIEQAAPVPQAPEAPEPDAAPRRPAAAAGIERRREAPVAAEPPATLPSQAETPVRKRAAPATPASTRTPATPVPDESGRTFEERLQILSGLYEKGLIDKQEYQSRRQKILDEI